MSRFLTTSSFYYILVLSVSVNLIFNVGSQKSEMELISCCLTSLYCTQLNKKWLVSSIDPQKHKGLSTIFFEKDGWMDELGFYVP